MLYPIFALALLTWGVLLTNLTLRIRALRARAVNPRYFKTFDGEAPDHVVAAARNLSNLFETPVLFYVAGIIAIITNAQGAVMVFLAWVYVLLRVVHSFIHLTSNHVPSRLAAFATSVAVLVVIWVMLGLHITAVLP